MARRTDRAQGAPDSSDTADEVGIRWVKRAKAGADSTQKSVTKVVETTTEARHSERTSVTLSLQELETLE